ncbi:hypothetical protein D3C83_01400 [compost metagenome]
MVFVTMAISSLSSGLLLNVSGWHAVNYGSIPFLVFATTATCWLMWQRRAASRTGRNQETQTPMASTDRR